MDKPILFQDDLVRMILSGRKTQTRRIVKIKGDLPHEDGTITQDRPEINQFTYWPPLPKPSIHDVNDGSKEPDINLTHFACPFGVPGDRLWVREVWAHDPFSDRIIYRSSWLNTTGIRWKSSIHMKKQYCRIWLEVTRIRIQRVQEISNDDAWCEGVSDSPEYNCIAYFKDVWERINGEKAGCSWEDNPYVWAIDFKQVDPGRKNFPGTQYARIVG